jgi:hypothetical protein
MSVFVRRTRSLCFRLSEEEYKTLKDASMASGAHSVSDYARDLVCADGFNFPNPASPQRSAPRHFRSGLATTRLEAEVTALRRHFDDLKTELKQLTERVEQMPPSDV